MIENVSVNFKFHIVVSVEEEVSFRLSSNNGLVIEESEFEFDS